MIDWWHVKAIFFMSVFGVSGGVLVTNKNPYLFGLGISLIIADFFIEYYFIKKMDMREEVNKTKQELRDYINEATKLKLDLEKTKKEINDMKEEIFDVFSKKGFKTVEERLKDLEEQIEGRYGNEGLKKEIEELQRDLDKIKYLLNNFNKRII